MSRQVKCKPNFNIKPFWLETQTIYNQFQIPNALVGAAIFVDLKEIVDVNFIPGIEFLAIVEAIWRGLVSLVSEMKWNILSRILFLFAWKPWVCGDQNCTNSLKKLGNQYIADKRMKRKTTSFKRQSISIEIKRENCAIILGRVESQKTLEQLYVLLDTKSDHYQNYGCFNQLYIFSCNLTKLKYIQNKNSIFFH